MSTQYVQGIAIMTTDDEGYASINFDHPLVKQHAARIRMQSPGITNEEIATFFVECLQMLNLLKSFIVFMSDDNQDIETMLTNSLAEAIHQQSQEAEQHINDHLSRN